MQINFGRFPYRLPKAKRANEQEILDFIEEWLNENNHIIVHTSGSTGTPKPIKLSKKAMILSAERTLNFLNIKKGETALLALPVRYIAGKMMIVRAIVGKLKLVAVDPHLNIDIPDLQIDFAAFIPMQMQNLIEENFNFSQIKKIIIGGAAINGFLMDKIKHLSTPIFVTYGMTETITHIALKQISGENASPCYHCLDNIKIGLYQGQKLWIKTPYFPQIIYTNDWVEIIDEKQFKWLGRADNIVNSGGLKINIEELERFINTVLKKNFFLAGLADKDLGEKLILFIEGEKNPNEHEKLWKLVTSKIPKAKLPKEIIYLKQFNYTATLKMNKKSTIEKYKSSQK